MNFFREQEEARQRIRFFRMAFHAVVILTTLATAWVITITDRPHPNDNISMMEITLDMRIQEQVRFLIVAALTYLFILMLSWFKRNELKAGGSAIAKMAGGTLVGPDETDPALRKLTNVVEEMSIAAGIVPPKVYVLPNELHINAFAAGFSSHDAVVAVSRGCLEKLNRDELQGVVAHEIGHILTGDMKINLELIGYLHGLMGISSLGRRLMRTRSSGRKNNSGLIGIIVFFVGLLGYFMGMILKFAISRGQEYHADAKAVQLTRNPEGIGGALKKILVSQNAYVFHSSRAHEISHFYFFYPSSGFFATHPPLPERIKRILPSFSSDAFKSHEKVKLETFMTSPEKETFIKSFSQPELFTPDLVGEASSLFDTLSTSPEKLEQTLVAMDINIGRLKGASETTRAKTLEKIRDLVVADKKINSRELICYALYKECLHEYSGRPKSRVLRQKIAESEILLTFLSKLGHNPEKAFAEGMQILFPTKSLVFRKNLQASEVMKALHSLKELRPYDKEILLKAAQAVIMHDKNKTSEESAFMKLLCQALDVPAIYP